MRSRIAATGLRARLAWLVPIAIAVLVVAALLGFNPFEPPPADDGAHQGLATRHEADLVFEAPAAWTVYHYEVMSSFTSVLAYLGTVEVQDPCTRTATTVSCASGYHLEPGTLVVTITAAGFPLRNALTGAGPEAIRVEVGGLPGLRVAAPAFPGVDADSSVVWRFARPGSMDNWYEIRAEIRGPGEDSLLRAVERMVDSVRFDPPVVPLDVTAAGRAKALAAVGRFLDAQAAEDPAWACFPRTEGARPAEITREPNGPALSAPLTVSCSTALSPTEFEMWDVTLRIDWGPEAGHAAGRWLAHLYGTGGAEGWSEWAESDPFPGAIGG